MVAWKVYYDDGSSFSATDGPPERAPKMGVQVIAVRDADVGRVLLHQFDYYWWDDGEWVGGCYTGMLDYLLFRQEPPTKVVLAGRAVTRDRYRAAIDAAVSDPELPRKSARREGEKPIPT